VDRLVEITTESETAFESAVAALAVAVEISNDWLELSEDSVVATDVAMLRAVKSVATRAVELAAEINNDWERLSDDSVTETLTALESAVEMRVD